MPNGSSLLGVLLPVITEDSGIKSIGYEDEIGNSGLIDARDHDLPTAPVQARGLSPVKAEQRVPHRLSCRTVGERDVAPQHKPCFRNAQPRFLIDRGTRRFGPIGGPCDVKLVTHQLQDGSSWRRASQTGTAW